MKELFTLIALIYVSGIHGVLVCADSDWAYVTVYVLCLFAYLAVGIAFDAADYRKERSR